MQARYQSHIEFNVSDILFRHTWKSGTLDLMITIGKMLLYYCKVNSIKPKLQWYRKRVEDTHDIEKYIVVKNKQTQYWMLN